jgi:hypothetical protein
MVVVGEDGVVMTAVAGLVDNADHVPAPAAAIVAMLPGQVFWSGPAFALADTITAAVSVHPPDVQMYLYEPAVVKPVIVVVGDVDVVIVVVAGFPVTAVHVPVPVAAIVAVLPGQRS